jgi:hypothetical protein
MMALDWSVVTVDHVRQACALYSAGTVAPKREAQTTFLLFDGRRYPAKFIRGLAYQIATGSRIDSDQYSGGLETVNFFKRLGLATDYQPGSVKTIGYTAPGASPSAPTPRAATVKNQTQKQALKALLERRFSEVKTEVGFEWLFVPTHMDGLVAEIHEKLRSLRGYDGFATAGRRLCYDFYIPSHRLLIEYDERQHFTLARASALRLYPSELTTHFDRSEWIAACEQVNASDPTPSYRDEQRALYDSLRDIRAAENGYILIRLRDRALDYTSADAPRLLGDLLRNCGVGSPDDEVAMIPEADRQVVIAYLRRNPNERYWEDLVGDVLGHSDSSIINAVGDSLRNVWKGRRRLGPSDEAEIEGLVQFIRSRAASLGQPSGAPPIRPPEPSYTKEVLDRLHAEDKIGKIAVVSHHYDYGHSGGEKLWDYSQHVDLINRTCDELGCDTILYALYTWDVRSVVPRTHESLFGHLKHVRRIVLECGDFSAHSNEPSYKDLWVEVWLRDEQKPFIVRQRFAEYKEASGKTRFVQELPGRQIGTALLAICGESQIVSESTTGGFTDNWGFLRKLAPLGVEVILNPVHDFMNQIHGFDICRKRRLYSEGGRTVISVWNEGNPRGDACVPWTVFHNGEDRTADVTEIDSPIPDRPDVRVGIVSLESI